MANELISKKLAATPASFLLLGVLFFVCLQGVDLTDEVQYYYQIDGLLSTGRLFSSDLYIQQLIYVVFYPIFKIYHIVFGEYGLILFGRVIFAALIWVLYEFLRSCFVSKEVDGLTSDFAALALALAPAYHGIFAISYNTISQIGWIYVVIVVAFQLQVNIVTWSAVISITCLAHPPGGVAIAIISSAHLMATRQFRKLAQIVLLTALTSLLLGGLIVFFSGGIDVLMRSFKFSAGFSVGVGLFDVPLLVDLALIGCLLIFAVYVPAHRSFGFPAIIFLCFLITSFIFYLLWLVSLEPATGFFPSRYSRRFLFGWVLLGFVAVYAMRCLQREASSNLSFAGSTAFITFFQVIILSGTSSNGISQAVGALSIFVPVIVAGIALTGVPQFPLLARVPAVAVGILAIIFTLAFPYRQDSLFSLGRTFSDVPMFVGLRLSSNQVRFFEEIRSQIDLPVETHGLLLSDTPGLYPILGLKPQTCMIYNHSLGSDSAREILLDCLLNLNLSLVMYVDWGAYGSDASRFTDLAERIASNNNLTCSSRAINIEYSPRFQVKASFPIVTICH